MVTITAAQAQKSVGENAAIKERVELGFDIRRQALPRFGLDLGKKSFRVILHQLIKGRGFRAAAFVVNRGPAWLNQYARHGRALLLFF